MKFWTEEDTRKMKMIGKHLKIAAWVVIGVTVLTGIANFTNGGF